MKKLNKNNKGFSLVELLVVIAIMVVLVGVIAPTVLGNIEKSREAKDIQSLDSVAAAIQYALADEAAFEEVDNKIHDVDDVFGSSATGDLATVAKDYLKTLPSMSGKAAKDSTCTMYYVYTKGGQVCVFVTDQSVDKTVDIENASAITTFLSKSSTTLKTKSEEYKVVR